MTICAQCNNPNNEGARFCTKCGAVLNVGSASPGNKSSDTQATTYPGGPAAQDQGRASSLPFTKKRVIVIISIVGIIAIGLIAKQYWGPAKASPSAAAPSKDTSSTNIEVQAPPPGLLSEAEILKFLNDWMGCQNEKNIGTYSNYYSNKFEGVKKTKSGSTYYLNHDEWIQDRTKMYAGAKNLSITTSNVSITNNTGQTATLSFTQSYISDAYSDIGQKVLEIKKNPAGQIYIDKEEMLESSSTGSDAGLNINDSRMGYCGAIGNYPIQMVITKVGSYECENGGNTYTGEYFYTKKGGEKKITVKGYSCGNEFHLTEYYADGTSNGSFSGIINGNSITGTFNSGKKYDFSLTRK